jgi:hypothetical protein
MYGMTTFERSVTSRSPGRPSGTRRTDASHTRSHREQVHVMTVAGCSKANVPGNAPVDVPIGLRPLRAAAPAYRSSERPHAELMRAHLTDLPTEPYCETPVGASSL